MHTINLLPHYTDTDYLPLSAMSPSLPILLLKVPYFSSYPLFDVLLVLNPPRIPRHSNKSAIGISIEKREDGPIRQKSDLKCFVS